MDLSDVWNDWAPGLRTLPDTLSGLRQAFDSGDLTSLADPTRVDSYVGLLLVGGTGYFAACLVLRQMRQALFAAPAVVPHLSRSEIEIDRPTNTSALRRLWWHIRPPHDLMRVDGLVIDRSRKPHCAWLGPTGAGKSASVATVRINGERPTLCAMPDLSDPIRDAAARLNGSFVWTACVSTAHPVNFLIGTPTEVAERLTEVFRSGGTGAWKRAARRLTAQVIRDMDERKEPRHLRTIGIELRVVVSHDRNLSLVVAGWVDRFLDMADQFGDSISPDGADLAELMRAGVTAVLDNDAFDHPALGGDVVALGLAEAKRIASLVPGGFRLIFEEAGQLGERIDLAEPFHRAGRRRKIAVDDLTQAESDLNEGISANIGTRVYFAQELKSLQKVAADRLGLDYRDLDPANMRDFTAWIAHGRIRRLVHFPAPPKAAVPRQDTLSEQFGTRVGDTGSEHTGPRYVIEEIKPQGNQRLALPAPSGIPALLAANLYRDGECERWRGDHNDKGYGRVRLPDGTRPYVHRLRWELAYGPIPLTEDGTRLTIDHRRTCYKDCSRLDHLELVTRSENSKRRWRVVGS